MGSGALEQWGRCSTRHGANLLKHRLHRRLFHRNIVAELQAQLTAVGESKQAAQAKISVSSDRTLLNPIQRVRIKARSVRALPRYGRIERRIGFIVAESKDLECHSAGKTQA